MSLLNNEYPHSASEIPNDRITATKSQTSKNDKIKYRFFILIPLYLLQIEYTINKVKSQSNKEIISFILSAP